MDSRFRHSKVRVCCTSHFQAPVTQCSTIAAPPDVILHVPSSLCKLVWKGPNPKQGVGDNLSQLLPVAQSVILLPFWRLRCTV